MKTPVYAIGDIHGQLGFLEDALALIEADGGPDARVVFLGDYVDRGPDSAGVIDLLATGVRAGRSWTCIKGNHDRMFEWFMEPEPRHDAHLPVGYHWFHDALGGVETMESYGVFMGARQRLWDVHAAARVSVPKAHLDFLRGLPTYCETDGLLFVHAGIRPGVPLTEQNEHDLLWIRKEFHQYTAMHPWLVVHGHTPVDQASHYGNRVNLDTGAGYGRSLSVAVFEDGASYLLTQRGRKLLSP